MAEELSITEILDANDIEATAADLTALVGLGTIDYAEVSLCDLLSAEAIHLAPLVADPVDTTNGLMWYRSDLGKLHININGVVKTLALDP